MLNKILNNLKKPHLVPIKILEKIEQFLYKKKYNGKLYEEKEKIIELFLFYKRLDSDNNCNPKKRQFIALIKKIN